MDYDNRGSSYQIFTFRTLIKVEGYSPLLNYSEKIPRIPSSIIPVSIYGSGTLFFDFNAVFARGFAITIVNYERFSVHLTEWFEKLHRLNGAAHLQD